jgi:hypothetical protein
VHAPTLEITTSEIFARKTVPAAVARQGRTACPLVGASDPQIR